MTVETQLRELFQQPDEPVDLHDHIRTAIRAGRRRRRVRSSLAVIATAAAVGLAIVMPRVLSDAPPPRPSEPSPDPVVDSAREWAAALPEGPMPAGLVSVAGNVLRQGDDAFTLPATDAGLIGTGPYGSLVLMAQESEPGATDFSFKSYHALVNPDGTVADLPQYHSPRYRAFEAAVSPDGTLAVYTDVIVDLQTKDIVATLPTGDGRFVAWTDAGIVFATATGEEFILDIGGESHPLVSATRNVSGSLEFESRRTGDCAQLIRVPLQSSAQTDVANTCDATRYVSISPDQRYVLDNTWGITDLESGQRRLLDGIRPDLPGRMNVNESVTWTSETEVSFTVSLTPALSPPDDVTNAWSAYIVSCDITTWTCSRTPRIRFDGGNLLQLAAGSPSS